MVEIFLPVETLRRVEIVDTPGLNSILAEHERVTRDFLQEADAIVWVFGIGQAAKATERAALELAHGAGKRVLGVLNKVDRAEPAEIEAVVDHVARSLGDLVETIVPFSATRATAARAAGKNDPALAALSTALDERFFTQARALKRATAISALRRLLVPARGVADAGAPAAQDFAAAGAALARVEQAVRRRARQRADRVARAPGRDLPARGARGARVRPPALVAVRRASRHHRRRGFPGRAARGFGDGRAGPHARGAAGGDRRGAPAAPARWTPRGSAARSSRRSIARSIASPPTRAA